MSVLTRRFQVGLLVVAGVVVIAALSAFAARDNLIRYTLNPNQNFRVEFQPTAPNYLTAGAWVQKSEQPSQPVDIFFLYPTVYFSGEYWNAPISSEAVKDRLNGTISPLYFKPFSSSGNLFVPYYRQAAPYSFMSGGENGRAARKLAYGDVRQAFKYFVDNLNDGRPFIIAGYGQGALYGLRLLSELEPKEKSRLVAAYLLEVAVPVELVTSYTKGVPLCDSPDQTGCSVIWHSTTQNGRGDIPRENALVWRPDGGLEPTRGRELACVNPLTWTISGRAGTPEMNLGAATLSEFGEDKVVITPSVTSADCWNGLLYTDVSPDPIFMWSGPRYRELFPSTTNPFFADIKDNVARRIETYSAQQIQVSEPAGPEGTVEENPAE